MAALLAIEDLQSAYGLSRVLFGISLDIAAGECVCLLGRNGMGKTTTMRSVMGLLRPTSGRVVWKGTDIAGWAPHRVARAGIGFVPEDRRVFAELTVWENLDVAARADALYRDEVEALLVSIGLCDQALSLGGTMSYGNQKQLELGLALASDPQVLLLDEPTAGMSPGETRETIRLLDRIAEQRGLTLLFTEHDMEVVFGIAQKIAVLHQGRLIADGAPAEVRNDPEVRRVYLGHGLAHA